MVEAQESLVEAKDPPTACTERILRGILRFAQDDTSPANGLHDLTAYTPAMKNALVVIFAMSLAACGGGERAGVSDSPAEVPAQSDGTEVEQSADQPPPYQGEVTDEKIGLPVYPGATEVEYSRVKLQGATGDTFAVHYRTTDSPAKVEAFYKVEGAKLGTLKESITMGEQLKTVSVARPDGTHSAIQAATDGKGVTVISLHRLYPN